MSSTTIVCIQLIILISNIIFIRLTTAVSQCDLSSAINLQSATYIHSLILRVQPINSSEEDYQKNRIDIRKVLVREVIKIPTVNQHQVKMNDIIIIRINDNDNDNDNEFLDNSCWHLLRISTIDVILFLNETNTDALDLHYPPVESTFRVRQHIDAVLSHETYSPQVLIKTRIDNPIVSKDYSIQCNSRGNPLPRLLWSKKTDRNKTLEYYPISKQCKTSCRIYSIQNKYQSILYFQSLTFNDIGIYVCHGENPMNHTTTSIYLNIDGDHHHQSNRNVTCPMKYCHNGGQCVVVKNHLKCLCDSRYFGERCETNYEDIIKKQDTAILLFKSRFLAGCIIVFVGFLLILIALLSWFLAKHSKKQQQQQKLKTKLPEKPSAEKPLISPVKEIISPKKITDTIPSSLSIKETAKSPSHVSPPPATVHISHSPMVERKPLTPPVIQQPYIQRTITRESSTATDDDDDEDGINSFLRHYQTIPPVPTRIDEEYEERFSLKMNKSEELSLGFLTNGINNSDLILSHGYADFYQPDTKTGLIKPLNIRNDPPQRYTKYVSSYSKFVLPRPVKPSSSSEYQQR